jgi:hypothetical protein
MSRLSDRLRSWFRGADCSPSPRLGPDAGPGAVLAEAERCLKGDDLPGALRALNWLKAKRAHLEEVDYLRGRYFLKAKLPADAIEALREQLRHAPNHRAAQDLLATLRARHAAPAMPLAPEFESIWRVISPATMLSQARLLSLFRLGKEVCERDLPGNFVECGVAAGGSAALLGAVIARYSRRPRTLFAFDTFEGLPEPGERDQHGGQAAAAAGWGAGTCAAPVDSLLAVCRSLGVEGMVEPVQGLFAQTLPAARERVGPIALLHMDGDWYASTLDILDNLYDQVVEMGRIQVDDYGYWAGCQQAVTEFQARRGRIFSMNLIDETGVWFTK